MRKTPLKALCAGFWRVRCGVGAVHLFTASGRYETFDYLPQPVIIWADPECAIKVYYNVYKHSYQYLMRVITLRVLQCLYQLCEESSKITGVSLTNTGQFISS